MTDPLNGREQALIEQLVVVGGGVMGRGIAYTGAVSGFHVKLVDKYEQVLQSARQEIEELFAGAVQRNKLTLEEAASAKERLSYHSDLEGSVQAADLVIEAVTEKLDLKKQIFEMLDRHAPAHGLLVSNTSTLSLPKSVRLRGVPIKSWPCTFLTRPTK